MYKYLLIGLLVIAEVSFAFNAESAVNYNYNKNIADIDELKDSKLLKYPIEESKTKVVKCNKLNKKECDSLANHKSANSGVSNDVGLHQNPGAPLSSVSINPDFTKFSNESQLKSKSVEQGILNSEITIKPNDSTEIKINQNKAEINISY